MASIDIADVRKSYGIHPVLHGIDLKIKDGEFVVLVGPSGCGKSTLLRMIAGLEGVTDGEIRIDGKRVNDLAPKDRDIAMVFQSYALYPHMSVARNMSYSLRLRKIAKEKIAAVVANAAGKLGLDPLMERRPKALSGGQRQRVAMGRAIVREPKAFLFDEPLSNLDARLREQMRAEIKKLHKDLGATSIYVTHDQIEAMTLADRIVAMHGGVIQQVGSPLELYDSPANLFVAGFIGSPGMNFFEGRYTTSGDAAAFTLDGGVVLPLGAKANLPDGSAATLGIRPEHVILGAEGADVFKATVDLVEPTGFGIIVHLKLGPVAFKAFTLDRRFLGMQGEVSVGMPVANLHFFNEAGDKV
ncbi:sn-glycerol-3-phosphate ABC transporter ATP-binding protein UgpC [Rhizobium sp. CECT 9324]|uniref:ABC transporter ATP-binding protein n=1 Tax=Rhizobium sp. CECT 9324 TaxID=2845820 RepID=UPI001E5E426F|nr:sn-glycerol-3-phosphate ABC transporter ATP-binding protein UgpC [Rhizobium sp. CECT 9324]CAH0338599.1 sn-glycerol-3-phosphate import ATP-binding protein UgpC [Rhizobium sp. CECT 9324]